MALRGSNLSNLSQTGNVSTAELPSANVSESTSTQQGNLRIKSKEGASVVPSRDSKSSIIPSQGNQSLPLSFLPGQQPPQPAAAASSAPSTSVSIGASASTKGLDSVSSRQVSPSIQSQLPTTKPIESPSLVSSQKDAPAVSEPPATVTKASTKFVSLYGSRTSMRNSQSFRSSPNIQRNAGQLSQNVAPTLPPPTPLVHTAEEDPSFDGVSAGPILLEVAWEVARKVGGIYTVLRSKVPFAKAKWKDRYALVGIYHEESALHEFEPCEPSPLTRRVILSLSQKYGVRVHFGRWLVPGFPRVFLFDLASSSQYLHQWRNDLMPGFAPHADTETNDAIIFGYQTAWLVSEFAQYRKMVVHHHEWLSGVGLILLARYQSPNVSTIFTTHATLLGRYLCAGRVDLYSCLSELDVDREAGVRGIYHRHWIERGAALGATVFSTVSEITAYEAEYILSRKVDVILPNGLNVEKFKALHEFQNLHAKYKEKLKDFVRGHFYGHFNFNLDKTLFFFTSGRYEYFNKGVDIFLDSLAELNAKLKLEGSSKTVIAFIIMPAPTNNYNVETLKGQSVIRNLKETCTQIMDSLSSQLFERALSGDVPAQLSIPAEDMVMLKRRVVDIRNRSSLPPIVTHNMVDDANNEILNHIRRIQLFNHDSDKVKIIYHPEFLSTSSTILPLEYPHFVRGCHLGVFTSYYEPWGYTPAECTVMGVPSISSNLTGFANYITSRVDEPSKSGIYIVDRRFRPYHETVSQIANCMLRFCHLSRRQRIELRNRTESLSSFLDWTLLGKQYIHAYKKAYATKFNENVHFGEIEI